MLDFWFGLLWPAFVMSLGYIGKSIAGLVYVLLVFTATPCWKWARGARSTALRQYLTEFFGLGLAVAVTVWLPFFVVALAESGFDRWHDAESRATKTQEQNFALLKEKAEIQVQLADQKHILQVLTVFQSYRRSIGADRDCIILITGAENVQDMGRMVGVLIQGSVPGSNCGNGNLLNIGVKPEDEQAESSKGTVPGFIVVHMLADAPGANQLVSDLQNILPVKRSYKFPMPTRGHVVWLQVGTGTKWNDEAR